MTARVLDSHDPIMARGEQVSVTARLALVLGLVGLCTLHKLHNKPVWDDAQNLEYATALRVQGEPLRVFSGSTLSQVVHEEGSRDIEQPIDLYRPLALLSFYAVDALAPGAPVLQHLVNTLLHLLCVLLVYLHARRLMAVADSRAQAAQGAQNTVNAPADQRALIAAAWFGFAPVVLEAHVWISGRFDLLSAALGLAGLLALARSRDAGRTRSARWLLAGVACAALLLGLLAKEPLLFALPAIVLWPRAQRLGLPARLRASWPALTAAGAYLLLRARVLHGVAGLDPGGERLRGALNAPVLLLDGALNALVPIAIYPRALNEDYAALGALAHGLCALVVIAIGVAIWRWRARVPLLAWSVLWLTCTLAPAALVTGAMWPGFGRHLYLPLSLGLVGVVHAGAELGQRLQPHLRFPHMLRWALWGYLALLAVRSHVAAYDWADERTLFTTIIAEAPQRSLGYAMLGITLSNRRHYIDAVPLLTRALELAPNERRWASRLGTALLFSGRRGEALRLANAWIAKLERAQEFHLLAAYATLDSDPDASRTHVLQCLKQDPAHAECREALQFLTRRASGARL